jgi:hypothetical protein
MNIILLVPMLIFFIVMVLLVANGVRQGKFPRLKDIFGK